MPYTKRHYDAAAAQRHNGRAIISHVQQEKRIHLGCVLRMDFLEAELLGERE